MSYTINIINDSNGTTVRTFTLSDNQVAALKDSIPGEQGIIAYLKGCIEGVINKCTKNLRRNWEPVLKDEYDQLPTNDAALIDLVISRPDYKDREERDAEAG